MSTTAPKDEAHRPGCDRLPEPVVVVAEDEDTLGRALAIEYVASTPASDIADSATLTKIRVALMEEQWGTAVAEWIEAVGSPVDVWTDEVMWTQRSIDEELFPLEMQFSPIFRD